MRRIGRKKQKKILIIGSLSLLLFLCVGYAAFSTSLNLKAKGNIKELSGAKVLRKKCNTESGDGLYKDIYEDDKCIFKGTNPNNYITFNDDEAGWRILSIESDNTIKIIKSSSIGNIQWNTSNANFENSYIQKYLNENFFSTIIKNEDKIQIHSWNIGNIKFNNDNLYEQINDEKNLQSQPIRIGLITVSEYLNANINTLLEAEKTKQAEVLKAAVSGINNLARLNGNGLIKYYRPDKPFSYNQGRLNTAEGTIIPDSSTEAFYMHVFSMQTNQISDVIKLDNGVAVIRLVSEEKPNMATLTTFDAATKNAVKRELSMQRMNLIQIEWENQHIADARVKKHNLR